MIRTASSISNELRSFLKAEQVVVFEDLGALWQQQLRCAVEEPGAIACVVYPASEAELAEVVACAARNRWRMLPAGCGSKLGWAHPASELDLVVSTARLNGLIEHSSGDLTATAQAGIAFGQLQSELARAGQFLPLDPAYGNEATLGGILATADAGALRHRYGSLRDLCLGVRFVRADGQVAKAGGRVVKNVAGYDLMKLLGGSFGTLGIVSEITVRLYPRPQATGTVILAGTPDWLQQRAQNLLASHLTPIAVEFLSPRWARRLEVSKEAALLVRFGGSTAGVAEQMGQLVGGTVYQPDAPLWERLQALPWEDSSRVVCKVGVLAAQVRTAIAGFEAIGCERGLAVSSRFAAGSGHGFLRFEPATVESLVEAIRAARALCQEHRGFLTILEAESTLKRQCHTWGFTGSALPLMGRIKRQFDPEGLLSPHRFVGGL